MRRLFIGAICLSPPGTMGGNSKITIEMARHLQASREVHFIVPANKVPTLTDSVVSGARLHIHAVEPFGRNEFCHPVAACRHYYREMDRVLRENGVSPADDFFSCCDFPSDAAPAFFLQGKYGFRWLPSAFLFVPGPIENLCRGYGFPLLPYFLAWVYARVYVFFASFRAAGFVITNRSDFTHFPECFRARRLFPFYGGVNVEQIPSDDAAKTRDVVFCSRLCAQKGIMGFLDIWRLVRAQLPKVRLTVIGNGAPAFERALKAKAVRLGVNDSIDWLGYVNNAEKYEIYRASRVMVHPTVFDNNGMVAAEALCSGLPVVMYDLPALRAVYTTGCVKVPYGDKMAFASAVIRLLSSPASSAPTPEQVADLRAKWNWFSRVDSFAGWLERL